VDGCPSVFRRREGVKVVFMGLGSNLVGLVRGHPGGVRGPVFLHRPCNSGIQAR